MTKILLTGGLGFIGSHTFIELLEGTEYEIVILDNLSNSSCGQLNKLESLKQTKIKFYNVDMMNVSALNSVFCENDFCSVIHFAGLKSVNDSIHEPVKYYAHNLQILLNLISTMQKHKVKNIIFSSSATVYGNNFKVCDENLPTGLNITNPYGKTKYFQEEILKDLYKSDPSWNITILRYFNPVGNHSSGLIGESTHSTNLFPCIVSSICNGTTLKVYGNTYDTYDGSCIRDFIHVVDLANAHVKALKCIGLNVYNVGTGVKTSIIDIIKTFERVNNIKINYEIVDKRDGDVDCTCANVSKIFNELDWRATRTIEDMCRDTYLFIKLN